MRLDTGAGPDTSVDGNTQTCHELAVDADGSFTALWSVETPPDSPGVDGYQYSEARRFAADGTPLEAVERSVPDAQYLVAQPGGATLAIGGLEATRIAADGTPGTSRRFDEEPLDNLLAAPRAGGGALIVWPDDTRHAPGPIRARLLDADGREEGDLLTLADGDPDVPSGPIALAAAGEGYGLLYAHGPRYLPPGSSRPTFLAILAADGTVLRRVSIGGDTVALAGSAAGFVVVRRDTVGVRNGGARALLRRYDVAGTARGPWLRLDPHAYRVDYPLVSLRDDGTALVSWVRAGAPPRYGWQALLAVLGPRGLGPTIDLGLYGGPADVHPQCHPLVAGRSGWWEMTAKPGSGYYARQITIGP